MQLNHMVTHGGEHAFHLMITPFADGQTNLRWGNHFQHRRLSEIFFVMQLHAFSKLFCRIVSYG
ncbi:Uncharacterised protein [Shigella sonnei]|nr:Uncharacterised protein [Shigella sonnei]